MLLIAIQCRRLRIGAAMGGCVRRILRLKIAEEEKGMIDGVQETIEEILRKGPIWAIDVNDGNPGVSEDKNLSKKLENHIDNFNRKLDYIEFCKSTNLNVSVVTDEESYSVIVSFVVSHLEFKDCFEYYNITLKKRSKIKSYSLRNRNNEQGGASHEFTNVDCGIYEMTIQPCYNSWQCAPFIIRYPDPINMTSFECIGLVIRNKLIVEQQFEKKIILIITVISVCLGLATGLVFCYYRSEKYSKKFISHEEDEFMTTGSADSPASKIDVYLIHYYGKNVKNEWKIKAFKEFCLLTSYFDTVKTITDELSLLLINVDYHLNKMMEKRGDDGSIRKIVLFASDKEEEDEVYGIENTIFSKFIDKLKDNLEECLHGYDHIFVVKLDSSVDCPEVLKGIVKRNRFTFSDDLMEEHLINLCLNMCSGSNRNISDVERNLRNLLVAHPLKHFESAA